jgi:hypothetical protein
MSEQMWLEWSDGRYPDDSPGDVISASTDGTIVLDDGITTWDPIRATEYFKGQVDALEVERDEAYAVGLRQIDELEAVINEVGPLMEEAMSRPLWGSLQGDWQERAREWHKKHNSLLREVAA